MIRTSNSSTVNFDKNSLSTVYWIGSFFSKLYRPPCFGYLFSTYAKGLIQYAYSLLFFRNSQMALASSTGLSPFPFLWTEPRHAGVSLFRYTGHGINFSNSCSQITGMVAHDTKNHIQKPHKLKILYQSPILGKKKTAAILTVV